MTGKDKAYSKASKMGLLFIPYEGDQPIELRTARHVTASKKAIDMLGMVKDGKDVVIENIPSYEQIKDDGIGPWLGKAK